MSTSLDRFMAGLAVGENLDGPSPEEHAFANEQFAQAVQQTTGVSSLIDCRQPVEHPVGCFLKARRIAVIEVDGSGGGAVARYPNPLAGFGSGKRYRNGLPGSYRKSRIEIGHPQSQVRPAGCLGSAVCSGGVVFGHNFEKCTIRGTECPNGSLPRPGGGIIVPFLVAKHGAVPIGKDFYVVSCIE